MPDLKTPFTLTGWALVPGPARMDEPRSSVDLQDPIEHSPAAIAESILAFPGTNLLHPAEPSWWEWKARWESGVRFIEIDMTLFEDEEQHWGGSELGANCTIEDVLALWSFIQFRHEGIWLHDPDCIMHTHSSFIEKLTAQ